MSGFLLSQLVLDSEGAGSPDVSKMALRWTCKALREDKGRGGRWPRSLASSSPGRFLPSSAHCPSTASTHRLLAHAIDQRTLSLEVLLSRRSSDSVILRLGCGLTGHGRLPERRRRAGSSQDGCSPSWVQEQVERADQGVGPYPQRRAGQPRCSWERLWGPAEAARVWTRRRRKRTR